MAKHLQDHEYSKFFVDQEGNSIVRVLQAGQQGINPNAKYVEASYTNGNKTVTYRYYESSAKNTLYNTIELNYSVAQDTSFVSSEWS